MKTANFIIPILYAIFVTVVLISIPYVHLIWFQESVKVSSKDVQGIVLNDNLFFTVNLTYIPIGGFLVQFLIAIISVYKKITKISNEVIFPIFSFTSLMVFGITSMSQIPQALNSTNLVALACFSGLVAFSLSLFLHFKEMMLSLESKLDEIKKETTNQKRVDFFAKRLELEHNTFQSMIQWIVWISVLFFTGGVATIAFKPAETIPLSLQHVILQNLVCVSLVGMIGLMIGVVMPILGYMRSLREMMQELV